jgi:hypothetical protein
MLLSAEVRWFWQGLAPELHEWFADSPVTPGGGEHRMDTYLWDGSQIELGVKTRGSEPGVDIKVLVSEQAYQELGRLRAKAQIWTKVSSKVLGLDRLPTIPTNKLRWLRKFDTSGSSIREIELGKNEKPISGERWPADGCTVEVTEVWFADRSRVWSTLGFEAFGSLERIEANLTAAVRHLGSRPMPDIGPGIESSYPRWLAAHAASEPRTPS